MVRVACCWDDGAVNDIRLIGLLRKYKAKATFNLNPGLMPEHTETPRWLAPGEKFWNYQEIPSLIGREGRFAPGEKCWHYQGYVNGKVGLKEMKEVYEGFQVASHGWFHLGGSTDPQAFIKDALDARHYLEDVFQRECPGYAWPFGDATPAAARLLKEAGFLYGRTTRNTDNVGFTDAPLRLDPSCHHADRGFYDKFRAAKAANGIFYFWGHSFEMLDCEGLWDQLERKLAFISGDPETEWIDVIDIVRSGKS